MEAQSPVQVLQKIWKKCRYLRNSPSKTDRALGYFKIAQTQSHVPAESGVTVL